MQRPDDIVQTVPPGQLSEAWAPEDDWMGIAERRERRRRQNRLSQRAYRKRKHLARFATIVTSHSPDVSGHHEAPREPGNTALVIAPSHADAANHASAWIAALITAARENAFTFKRMLLLDQGLRIQAPSDLPTLARMNVLNALSSNAAALSITLLELEEDDSISPFNLAGPRPPDQPRHLPAAHNSSLSPTALQKAVVHHPWIDLFPAPGMRDNMLRSISAAEVDEDALCGEFLAMEDGDDAIASLVVWGDPGDASSWELSPGFLRRWSCLVQGCPEIVEATNFWRRRRGRPEVVFAFDNEGKLIECSLNLA